MNNKINILLVCTTLMGVVVSNEVKAFDLVTPSQTFEVAQMTPRGKDRPKYDKNKLTEKLNLTSQQKQQMGEIKAKYEPQIKALRQEMGAERSKLRDMMRNNESSANIRSQNQVITDLGQKMRTLAFESMLEMREVLTPEQREQFAELMEERRANRPQFN